MALCGAVITAGHAAEAPAKWLRLFHVNLVSKEGVSMSNNSVCGSIVFIDETREYGDNGFRKRLMVLTQNQGKYDNYIPVEFIQDMCDKCDELRMGSEVTVEYKIKGRKWVTPEGNDRYFVNLEVVDVIDHEAEMAFEQSMSNEKDTEDNSDVPF